MQDRLRKERLSANVNGFARDLEDSDRHPEIAIALWKILQERAFVDDFRPEVDDDLYKIFAMDPEIVRDELVDVMLSRLSLSVEGIDFSGFDFASIKTPRDVSRFVVKVADAQSKAGKHPIGDLAE